MAYTLKAAPFGSASKKPTFCLAVDQDGTTLKDFADSPADITTPGSGISSTTFSGNTIYGVDVAGASTPVVFGTNKPTWSLGVGEQKTIVIIERSQPTDLGVAFGTITGSAINNTLGMGSTTNIGGSIASVTRANPCVITFASTEPTGTRNPGHGFQDGDLFRLAGFTGDWAALNGNHTATAITEDSFSIPVDTSSYGSDWVSGGSVYSVRPYWRSNQVLCGRGFLKTISVPETRMVAYVVDEAVNASSFVYTKTDSGTLADRTWFAYNITSWTFDLDYIGRRNDSTYGAYSGTIYLVAFFDVGLSLSDLQAIESDPYGALFDAGGISGAPSRSVLAGGSSGDIGSLILASKLDGVLQ